MKPRLRFEEWDSEAFEAWESTFDRAYEPPPPALVPSPPAPQADADAASARPPVTSPVTEELDADAHAASVLLPVVEELEEPWQPPADVGSLSAMEAAIPPPPSTLRGLAPSEPRLGPAREQLPSLVATDQWPALGPTPEEEAPTTQAPSTSSVPPVVLAVEGDFDAETEERSTSEAPARDARAARARRLRAWMLAAAAVLVAPGLAGLFLTATGTPAHASSAMGRGAHVVEMTSSPLQVETRERAPRKARPAKAKPGRRSIKHRRR